MYKASNFPISSPALLIICLFYLSHSSGCELIAPCGFNWHFPSDDEHLPMWLFVINIDTVVCLIIIDL